MSEETMEAFLERSRREIPALAPLLSAFGPVLKALAVLRESAPGWTGPTPDVDAEAFAAGRPVLPADGFQNPGTALVGAAGTLLPVLARCFPALAADCATLERSLTTGLIRTEELWDVAFGAAPEFPGAAGLDKDFLRLAAGELARPFVERQARDLLTPTAGLPWRRATCPVCGGAPAMSMLRKDCDESDFVQANGGRRYLRCSCCASEWTYKRVSCPSCGCENPDELLVLANPERPNERADCCTRCKTFLPCLNTADFVSAPPADAAALVMAPLETRAEARGFRPLAGHLWTGLMT